MARLFCTSHFGFSSYTLSSEGNYLYHWGTICKYTDHTKEKKSTGTDIHLYRNGLGSDEGHQAVQVIQLQFIQLQFNSTSSFYVLCKTATIEPDFLFQKPVFMQEQ